MLFQETTITSYAQALLVMKAYADALGWTTTASVAPGEQRATFTAPVGAGRPSPITYSATATIDSLFFKGEDVDGSMQAQVVPVPTSDSVDTFPPSRITMFGGTLPEPWMAAVLTYEFNYYRHIYVGHLERKGGFTGGEVLSITNGPAKEHGSLADPRYRDIREGTGSYLFSAQSHFGSNNAPNCGGAHIVHANNSAPWRRFHCVYPTTLWDGGGNTDIIMGGWSDGPNDLYFARANASFASAQMLTPFNLYINNDNHRWHPVGAVVGVRYVDMTNLAPEQRVTVATDAYKVYPDTSRKASRISAPLSIAGSALPRDHTSGTIGYAYPENPA